MLRKLSTSREQVMIFLIHLLCSAEFAAVIAVWSCKAFQSSAADVLQILKLLCKGGKLWLEVL